MFKFDLPLEKIKEKYVDDTAQFITIDGLDIHYKDEGYGETILLLHDTVMSLQMWDEWTVHLKEHFRVIRLDLPGFGITGTIHNEPISLDTYIYFLKKFTTKLGLGLEEFFIGGAGFGGHLAWQYTLLHQHRIKKLCLVHALGYPNQSESFTVRAARNWFGKHFIKSWASKKWIERNLLKEFGNKKRVEESLVQQILDLLIRKGNRANLRRYANLPLKNRSHRIKEIQTPTLLLNGTLHPIKDKFAQDLPNVIQKQYDGIGRYPMIEYASHSANDLIQFLQS